MPVQIIIFTGLALMFRLAMGGYQIIKPSIFVTVVSIAAVLLFLFCLRKNVRKPIEARMLAIAVAMPLLAWSIPNLLLLFLIMCFWVPIAAGRFNLIAPVYLFSLLLLPALDYTLFIGSIKLVHFGVHDALAIGAAAAIFLNPAKAKCRPEWDAIAFSLVIVISTALARDLGVSHHLRVLIEISLDLALPYYIVSRGLRTGEDLRSAMLWLSAGGITVGAILLLEVWKGWPIYNELYRDYQLPTVLMSKVRAGLIRPGGPFVEPTSAALVVAICTLALYLSRDYIRTQRCYLLLMAVALAGLIAPQSRGAWIGLGIAIAAADILRGRYIQLGRKILVLGGAVSFLFVAAHSSYYLSETLGLSGGSADTNDYRRDLLTRGWEEFLHRPVFGYSTAELEHRLADMVQGEGIIDFVNGYIWIMLIAGAVGLFIFVGAFLYFLINTFRSGEFRGPAKRDVEAGVFIFCALLMLMEMFFFTSFWARPASYLLALLGFASAFLRLQRGVVAETQASPQQPGGLSEPLNLKPSL